LNKNEASLQPQNQVVLKDIREQLNFKAD